MIQIDCLFLSNQVLNSEIIGEKYDQPSLIDVSGIGLELVLDFNGGGGLGGGSPAPVPAAVTHFPIILGFEFNR